MLAVLGFIVQEFVRLPGDLYSEANPVKAFAQVRGLGGNAGLVCQDVFGA
jgi:hypothetical protein